MGTLYASDTPPASVPDDPPLEETATRKHPLPPQVINGKTITIGNH